MQEILDHSIFGNAISAYLMSLGIFLGCMAIVYAFKRYLLGRIKRWAESTETRIDDMLVRAIEKSLVPAIYLVAFYAALHTWHSRRSSGTV